MAEEKYVYRSYKIKLDNALTKEDMEILNFQFTENTRLYNSILYFARMKFFSFIDENHVGIKHDEIKNYQIQNWFNDKKNSMGASYAFIKILKPIMTKNEIYLNKKVASATAIKLAKNWKSFYKLKGIQLNRQIPNYFKNGRLSVLEYDTQAISQDKKKSNYIIPAGFKTGVLKPEKYLDKKIEQVKIIKKLKSYYMIVIYKEKLKPKYKAKKNRVAAMDFGVNILAMLIFSTNKKPIGFSGRKLKSLNQWYNKHIAELQSKLPKGQYTSKKIQSLWDKRDKQVNHYLHCLTNKIVEVISKEQISMLVIGKNDNFQNNANLGRVNNQNFVNIPFGKIISLLKYKLEGTCEVVEQEESYTSKASSYSLDEIPTYDKEKPKTYKFSGKRITRGMYKVNDGKQRKEKYVHADVNGAYNIMRKYLNVSKQSENSKGMARISKCSNLRNWLRRGGVVTPYVIDIKLS